MTSFLPVGLGFTLADHAAILLLGLIASTLNLPLLLLARTIVRETRDALAATERGGDPSRPASPPESATTGPAGTRA
jgi:hypothetical protein